MYEFYALGTTYDEVHAHNRTQAKSLWERYVENTSFKFAINAYMGMSTKAHQREIVESFSYMGFKGKIDMMNPEVVMTCFEECENMFLLSSQRGFDGIAFLSF